MRKILLVLGVLVTVVLGFAGPAGAAVNYSGSPMRQYVVNDWPLIALVDHTSQNPNWYHVRDQGFASWGDPLSNTSGPYVAFQVTDDCGPWVNRVCAEIVERNLGASGSVDNCGWTGAPTLIGITCRFTKIQGSPIVDKAVIIMGSNQHGQTSAIRVAATDHEIGHAYGLNHVSDPAYLMYPVVDGNPGSPRGQESGCVYEIYNAPPCISTNGQAKPNTAPALPLVGTRVQGEPLYTGGTK